MIMLALDRWHMRDYRLLHLFFATMPGRVPCDHILVDIRVITILAEFADFAIIESDIYLGRCLRRGVCFLFVVPSSQVRQLVLFTTTLLHAATLNFLLAV